LKDKGWFKPLQEYINSNRPFFGICIGMQSLFEGSDESSEEEGLGIIPGRVKKFQSSLNAKIRIPHIGWNGVSLVKSSPVTDFLALENAVND
jgi:glutamine amidotransferase/cyclase